MKKPSGSVSLQRCRRSSASPSPVETPGSGSAEIVAELSWLNCSIAAGEALVAMLTTADSGTISPVAARTKNCAEPLGVVAALARHLGDDVVAVRIAVELADRAAADQQAERGADVADRHVEARRAVAVDGDRDLRRVEGERVLHHDEAAGRLRLLLDLLGDLEDPRSGRGSTG